MESCTTCHTPVSHTSDWTLYPWPDGAKLCASCNDARHEAEDYNEVDTTCSALERLFETEWTALSLQAKQDILRDINDNGGESPVINLAVYRSSIGKGNLASYARTQRVRFHRLDLTGYVEISGSHGTLVIDPTTGVVQCEKCTFLDDEYRTVVRFDVEEWQKAYPGESLEGGDILDFGYTYLDAQGNEVVEPPCLDWREDYRKSRTEKQ